MKLIAVDVGNTSTAVGLWSGGRVSRVSHVDGDTGLAPRAQDRLAASAVAPRAQDRAAAFAAAEALRALGADGIAYVSVVPRADAEWQRFAKRQGVPFVRVNHELFGAASDLSLDYPHPETIGADRLADAAAAVDRYGAPVIVCDFGTAFTAAAVTSDLVWRGGVIAPGFPLMRDYLYERTAKLPRMKLGGRCPKIGRSTEEAMRFGALVGYRGMVREIVSTLARNFKTDFRLVATGGFAKWVLRDSGMPFVIDQTLTLHGAGLLAANRL